MSSLRFRLHQSIVTAVGVVMFFGGAMIAADQAVVEEEVKRIRKFYAEVEALQELRQEDIEFQCPADPMQGVLTRRFRRDTGKIVRLDLGYLIGDHDGADEMYYYRDNQVFFVLVSESSWRFVEKKGAKPGEGATMDSLRERRFYFSGGRCIRVLEKTASSEKQEDLKGLIGKAENRELSLVEASTKEIVSEILRKAGALPGISDPKAAAKFFCE